MIPQARPRATVRPLPRESVVESEAVSPIDEDLADLEPDLVRAYGVPFRRARSGRRATGISNEGLPF